VILNIKFTKMKRKIKLHVAWAVAVLMVFAGCSKEGFNLNEDLTNPEYFTEEYTARANNAASN
jgi:hypothetical protein